HDQPGEQGEAHQELDRSRDLVDHRLHLLEHGGHVDDQQVGEAANEFVEQVLAPLGQAERRDVADRQAVERARRHDHEEIRAERVPLDPAQARHRERAAHARHVVDQAIAHAHADPAGDALLHRHQRGATIGLRPPAAVDDHVVVLQPIGEREIRLAIDQPAGALVGVVLRLHRAPVEFDQPAAHHR
ncbi:MAG: hypothetical protein ACK559_22280, partial [bacterium]